MFGQHPSVLKSPLPTAWEDTAVATLGYNNTSRTQSSVSGWKLVSLDDHTYAYIKLGYADI